MIVFVTYSALDPLSSVIHPLPSVICHSPSTIPGPGAELRTLISPPDPAMIRHVVASPRYPWRTRQGGQEPAVFDRILPLIVVTVAVLSIARAVPAGEPAKKPTSILAFSVQDIDGKPVGLSKYKGDVLLIVNTASQCGSTPQYERLESICETYKPQGFDSNSRTAISQGKTRGSRRRSSQTLVQYIFSLIGLQQGKLQGILSMPPC